jgi:thiol:disulfide interchange protein DsbD
MLTLLFAFALVARPADAAAPKASELVQAELLADVAAVKPGEEFTLGVLLKIKPKWHIYWKYPGDAGLPTTVKWTLPQASSDAPQPETKLPFPVQFDQPGDVVGYGYKDEVLLTARVKAPQGAAGSSAEFVGDVSFLVCESICLPGKAKVSLTVPLADQTKPANEELFKKWVAQIPHPPDESVGASLAIEKVGDRAFNAKFTLPEGLAATDVNWFPLPPKGVGVEGAQTKSDSSGSVFSFSLVPLPKESATMQFLVTYTDPSGKRQGIEFVENLPTPLPK